jgi:lytic murein transglycosylase
MTNVPLLSQRFPKTLLLTTFAIPFMILHSIPSIATGAASNPPTNLSHCEKDLSFDAWLTEFQKDALSAGISAKTLALAVSQMTYDKNVIDRDRGQKVFQQSFLKFSDRMASDSRIRNGARLIRQNPDLFAKIEKQFGIPAPVLVAYWGLESDFGSNTGQFQIISSVTTLAYDCRRADFFRGELLDALRLLDRGDLQITEMTGSWAGELGGTQLTPTDYYKYAVDYDGDGKANLKTSIPDTLATSANFLMNLGWRAGEPWLQEVQVPATLPWQEADLNIQHSIAEWKNWGVVPAQGSFPITDLPASLILPMGRFGPAFLAYPNFQIYLGWNASVVYSTTAAYLALRIAGAPAMGRGSRVITSLTTEQMAELQRLLAKQGYDIGTIDGMFGNATRAAVKKAQIKMGLPADSFPGLEVLEALRLLP